LQPVLVRVRQVLVLEPQLVRVRPVQQVLRPQVQGLQGLQGLQQGQRRHS
jgi:hypothetical protein